MNEIHELIYTIRGLQVMLDSDLAKMYGVVTKRLNEQVRRNIERFPDSFCFIITEEEYDDLISQKQHKIYLRSQFATLEHSDNKRGHHRKYLPFVFTEQGVAMLSAVLKSEVAITTSIKIIHAFVDMRKFLINNAQIFQRLDNLEIKQFQTDHKVDKLFDALATKQLKYKQGIFFDGQIFDAYQFVSDLIRSATKTIKLIDNYVDDKILTLFSKKNKDVNVLIFTQNIDEKLLLDIKKFNKSHDRFLIIDDKEIYHFGASLKDLGKRWFAFSRIEKDSLLIVEKLKGVERIRTAE